jgi:hypothetical protein
MRIKIIAVATLAMLGQAYAWAFFNKEQPPADYLSKQVYGPCYDGLPYHFSVRQLEEHYRKLPGFQQSSWEKIDDKTWRFKSKITDLATEKTDNVVMVLIEYVRPAVSGVLVASVALNGESTDASTACLALLGIDNAANQ